MKKKRNPKNPSSVEKKVSEKNLNKVSGGSGKWDWREEQRAKEENDYNNTHFKD
ncbi:hypothetical protein [Legionella cardiaca]|uniref:Uncharacterized protein n=1 Tax=Legionella cardiaca TaxID=1071983 RepID=A0ABY8AQT3_9GAMM|nr:hypothetical protein [Legionella cardiaca]WED43053.1 hypothetical protein PXX05_14320 [Legionella cardiaca]